MTLQPILDGEKEKGGAMPLRGRSGVPSGLSPVSRSQPKAPAAIADHRGTLRPTFVCRTLKPPHMRGHRQWLKLEVKR